MYFEGVALLFAMHLAGTFASAIEERYPVSPIPTVEPTSTSNQVKTHCPTFTSTGSICSSCIVPMCLMLTTVSNPCDCPTPVPTVTVDYPCGTPCKFGCQTSYIYATSTSTCPKSTTASEAGPTITKCVATVTVDTHPSSGCTYSCSSAFCIIDKFVTAPCGCTSVGVFTETNMLPCPTTTGCVECYTGFPWTTYPASCPTPVGTIS